MAYNYPPRQAPRVQQWDAARPTGVIVDPTAPSYMPIPERLPPGSPPGALLALAKTANLIVSTNNSTYVQPGPVQDQLTTKLSEHRAQIELQEQLVQDIHARKSRDCWTFFKPEDPILETVREKALKLYDDVGFLAAETTLTSKVQSSASKYPKGNIKFEHPTFADPFYVPERSPRRTQDGSDDEENDEDRDLRASLSSANGDWGSVQRERGPLRVMNPGTTTTSGSTRTRSDSGSTAGWSTSAQAGYPPVNHSGGADSRQRTPAHSALPPAAPPLERSGASSHHAYTPAAPSVGHSRHSGGNRATLSTPHAPRGTDRATSSSARTSSTIRAPPAAHLRHSSGSAHPNGRTPTYRSNAPTYTSASYNATPAYAAQATALEPQVLEDSPVHSQYVRATHNVEQGLKYLYPGSSRL
ncbi:hypothetical protein AURDEDRAFT_127030 [Auricularia subglabra TFB-10046 SS5]|nr:hypothetical protein AURDEDRAFT_127030 [Auricularia subglabra TFB-10046 SS5]